MIGRAGITLLIVFVCLCKLAGETHASEDKFSPEQIDFFESRIRPLLANHCLECHGATDPESDLRLDSRNAIMRGGSSGKPGAVAGSPESSLIMQSVRHTGEFEMPPNKQLSEQEIEDLSRWIAMKLPWPKSVAAITEFTMDELIDRHQKLHWAYQPVRIPRIPDVDSRFNSNIDKLIVDKLESRHLSLSPRADRRTLIRRASFDLTGLPPTWVEVEAFVNDDSPTAYESLIDRLLASRQYGERWARHWLDVARYADTSGYALANVDNRYPFAFTYRDYVIDAFNSDLPYDQFIREQLAADHLDVPPDKKTLAALGFITVGRKYLGRPDTIDDQVDVVTRGLMGLTVSCARCHDHKYDAIPTVDYYSIYSIFANNHVPEELPLIGDRQQRVKFQSYFEELAELKNAVQSFRELKHKELLLHIHEHFPDYLARVIAPNQESKIEKQRFVKLRGEDVQKAVVSKWRTYLAQHHENETIIKPSLELIGIHDAEFEQHAARMINRWSTHPDETLINSLYLEKLNSNPPKHKIELAEILGSLFSETLEKWRSGGSLEPPLGQFDGPHRDIAAILLGDHSPARLPIDQLDEYLDRPAKLEIRKLQEAVGKHNAKAPDGLARAMILRDNERLVDQRVMLRGHSHRLGEPAPRRFVALLSQPGTDHSIERPVFKNKSGRLELAEKIASPENPLTARVLVNRVWMHHFSQPLVDTPSDFGIRCEPPLQQALLDLLAAGFVKNGWSIKQLHRTIMLSETYCQSSVERPNCFQVDPENRLFWKMNRRRLEFEPLRDSILAVAGQLDLTQYGKAVDLFQRPLSRRRTIYGLIDRQDLPGLYRVFDIASPDQSAAKRIRTTVPQQSLFMMNSTFVTQQARHLIETIPGFDTDSIDRQRERLKRLYRAVYQRDPNERELEIGMTFIQSATPGDDENSLDPWQRFAQILFCTNEFEFID